MVILIQIIFICLNFALKCLENNCLNPGNKFWVFNLFINFGQVEYRLRDIVSYKEISKSIVSFTLRVQASLGGEVIHGHFYLHIAPHNEMQRATLLSSGE